MTGKPTKKRATAKKPVARRKPAAKKPADNTQPPAAPAAPPAMKPLDKQAFQMVLQIIDQADIKGGEAGNIILLKKELARVAGVTAQSPAG